MLNDVCREYRGGVVVVPVGYEGHVRGHVLDLDGRRGRGREGKVLGACVVVDVAVVVVVVLLGCGDCWESAFEIEIFRCRRLDGFEGAVFNYY